MPEEEEAELAAGLRTKGFAVDEAARYRAPVCSEIGDGPRHAGPGRATADRTIEANGYDR